MNSPEVEFDKWLLASKLAPRLHHIPDLIAAPFEKQRRAFNRRKGEFYSLLRPEKHIELHLDFIDDPSCNSWAGISEDGTWGLIAVTVGAIMLPLEMFSNMLSHPGVLPELTGGQAKERRTSRHNEGLLTNYRELLDMRRKLGQPEVRDVPADPVRWEIAQLCMEIAWSLMMLHETVHIGHGHIDYLRSTVPTAYAMAATAQAAIHPNQECPALDDVDLQALELWADNKAIEISLGGFLTKSWDSILIRTFPKPEQKIFIWAFAVYTLFRIWELKTDPTNLWGDHPPTVLRFQLALSGAEITAAYQLPELDLNFFRRAVMLGIQAAERAIVFCGGEKIDASAATGLRDPRVLAHANMLVDHYERVLRQKLPDHAYVRLHDPASSGV